jgi:hypothetical protein
MASGKRLLLVGCDCATTSTPSPWFIIDHLANTRSPELPRLLANADMAIICQPVAIASLGAFAAEMPSRFRLRLVFATPEAVDKELLDTLGDLGVPVFPAASGFELGTLVEQAAVRLDRIVSEGCVATREALNGEAVEFTYAAGSPS